MHRRALALSICLTSTALNWLFSPSAVLAQDVTIKAQADTQSKTTTAGNDAALTVAETQEINDLLNRIAGIDRAQKSLENEAPDTIEREKALTYNRKTIQESEQKLAAFGPRAIPLLIEALNRSERDVSEAASRVLLTCGPQIVKPIIVSLANRTLTAQKGKSVAAGTLEQLGSDTNGALKDMLDSGSDAERLATMRLIADMAPTPPGIHRVSSFGYYRFNREYENQWVVPSSLIQPICAATADKSKSIRRTAVETLGKIGPRNATLIQTVCRVLKKDPDESVRRTAATALGEIGSLQSSGPAAHTVEVLAATMTTDEYEGARMAAAKAIGKVQQAPNAVKTLVLGLNDPVQMVKDSCISSLENMGPAAAPAVPDLIECLNSPNARQSEHAARALARIGPAAAPALPAIIKLARGSTTYSSIKYTLADACINMGAQASSAVPMLIEMLKDHDNRGNQYMAVDALAAIGPAAISAEPALEETLKDPALKHRSETALKKIRGQSTTVLTPGTTPAPGNNASPTSPVVTPRTGDELI